MSRFDRRDFLKTSGGLLSLAAVGGLAAGCAEPDEPQQAATATAAASDWSGFRYAMCNECMQGRPWAEQCQVISEAGYGAVEIAPFSLVVDYGKNSVRDFTAADRAEFRRVMDDHGLECVGLHWLFTPPPDGLHFTTPDDAVRQQAVDYLRALIDFSADLNGPYLIFGSPGQRSTTGGSTVGEAKRRLVDGLAAVADHAADRGVAVLLEHLSPDQTDVINLLFEAKEIVDAVGRPEAINAMFDYHNTTGELDPFDTLIRDYADYIKHVQIQEMDGQYLGTGNAVNDYVASFQTFKEIGYNGWISLEIFDFEPEDEVIANESMRVLKELEAKVT